MPRRNRAWNRAAAAGTRWGGHPPAGRREHRVRFWEAIARGASSEKAAVEAGVLPSIGVRWFRKGGGMPPLTPRAGVRALSVLHRARGDRGPARRRLWGAGDRASARSCAVDDLPRAAAQRCDRTRPRLSIEPRPPRRHAERRARRPKPAKLAVNPELRAYVQDRLSGTVQRPDGSVAGPDIALAWAASRTAQGPPLGTVLEPGADLRSPPRWTSPMMSRCACLMRRSISRSMSRAAERCAAS